jgi:DNA-damage-inducible protein J
MLVQVATRVDEHEKNVFDAITKDLGITPADALRIFIKAFDKASGFPFELKSGIRYQPIPNLDKAKHTRLTTGKDGNFQADKKFLNKFADAWEI